MVGEASGTNPKTETGNLTQPHQRLVFLVVRAMERLPPLELRFGVILAIAYHQLCIFIEMHFLEIEALIHEILRQLHFHDVFSLRFVENAF